MTGDDSAIAEINTEFDAYFKVRLDKLRREPEDNLLSGLVHAETEEGKLSQEDLLVDLPAAARRRQRDDHGPDHQLRARLRSSPTR